MDNKTEGYKRHNGQLGALSFRETSFSLLLRFYFGKNERLLNAGSRLQRICNVPERWRFFWNFSSKSSSSFRYDAALVGKFSFGYLLKFHKVEVRAKLGSNLKQQIPGKKFEGEDVYLLIYIAREKICQGDWRMRWKERRANLPREQICRVVKEKRKIGFCLQTAVYFAPPLCRVRYAKVQLKKANLIQPSSLRQSCIK